jgi:hypothetical protein
VAAVRCLSFHRDYQCRDRGACCSSDWPIPLERDRVAAIETALASGRVTVVGNSRALERPLHAPAETPIVLGRAGGRCVFFTGPGRPGCAIHAALGASAMPLACRQFPRVSLLDPRGASVTLSHYCPTAAAMLARQESVTIDAEPPAFPADAEYVGLDVRDHLPPLIRPNLLMDWESWWRLEALAVDALANDAGTIEARLTRLRRAVAHAGAWRPGIGELRERVEDAFRDPATPPLAGADVDDLIRAALRAVPEDLRSQTPRPSASAAPDAGQTGRFLAAHAFANWTAHLGRGLEDWLRSIETAWALVRGGYSFADADLILRHLSESGVGGGSEGGRSRV